MELPRIPTGAEPASAKDDVTRATNARIVSVRVGRPRTLPRPEWDHHVRREWRSAYLKDEVAGPVEIGRLGLAGDEQADKTHHGGPHMAVLAYGADHYAAWREELGIPEFGPGAFGENLSVTGWDESSVCIGDRFAAGEVVFEVSQPRGPCAHISRRWNREDLLGRVTKHGWPGWYLRVIEPGRVTLGDAFARVACPHPEWSVARVFAYYTRERHDADGLRALLVLDDLAPVWRETFGKRLEASGE